MIPKIIHYCWLSDNPIPAEMQEYMDSWRKLLPDYEFMKWDFNRFPKNKSIWVSEAFDNKKYAFAADYLRLYALYNYGGIYMDMDVEVLKSFNPMLELKSMLCYETVELKGHGPSIEAATMGVEKHSQWIKDCLDYYEGRHFVLPNGKFDMRILPLIIMEILTKKYTVKLVENIEAAKCVSANIIPILPAKYFSPRNYLTLEDKITPETYSIHHYTGSWNYTESEVQLRNLLIGKYHIRSSIVDYYILYKRNGFLLSVYKFIRHIFRKI